MFFAVVGVLRAVFAKSCGKEPVGRESHFHKHLDHVHGAFGRKIPVRVCGRTTKRNIIRKTAHHDNIRRIKRFKKSLADAANHALTFLGEIGAVYREQEARLNLDFTVFKRDKPRLDRSLQAFG